jgi:hypothetical protein
VKTGENLFYNTFKMISYSYFKQNAEVIVNFNQCMEEKTKSRLFRFVKLRIFQKLRQLWMGQGKVAS